MDTNVTSSNLDESSKLVNVHMRNRKRTSKSRDSKLSKRTPSPKKGG